MASHYTDSWGKHGASLAASMPDRTYSVLQLLCMRPEKTTVAASSGLFRLEAVDACKRTQGLRQPEHKPVTEYFRVSTASLERKRGELRRIAQNSRAVIREKVGLHGVNLLISGTATAVEQALSSAERLFSEEPQDSHGYTRSAVDCKPSPPADILPPPGLAREGDPAPEAPSEHTAVAGRFESASVNAKRCKHPQAASAQQPASVSEDEPLPVARPPPSGALPAWEPSLTALREVSGWQGFQTVVRRRGAGNSAQAGVVVASPVPGAPPQPLSKGKGSLPLQRRAPATPLAALRRSGVSENSASHPKWGAFSWKAKSLAQREQQQEEVDPELLCYVWDRKVQRTRLPLAGCGHGTAARPHL
mmetsp:Transcript_72004/g.166751  ORF Transcript_72004/g.166751 Transcript_72004/m.166751 type:complete len:362 (+) Transcript_72004:54-1139(+)